MNAMSKKQVTVTIKRTKRKEADQPWVATIHPGGKAEPYTMKQRYADKKGAKKGALRNLKAVNKLGDAFNRQTRPFDFVWFTPKGTIIVFEYK